jgi:hypothetical protein
MRLSISLWLARRGNDGALDSIVSVYLSELLLQNQNEMYHCWRAKNMKNDNIYACFAKKPWGGCKKPFYRVADGQSCRKNGHPAGLEYFPQKLSTGGGWLG